MEVTMTTQSQPNWPGESGGGSGPAPADPAGLRDQVRWGSVWAGVLVALPVFIVLQLLLFSLSVLDLGVTGEGQGTTTSIVSAIVALLAFFVGGLMAGKTAAAHASDEGLLHGVLTWALGIVAILGLALLGGGALLGNLATAASQVGGLGQQAGQAASQIDPAQALAAAQQGAGWAALGLGLSVAAAAAGGILGASMSPSRTQHSDMS